MIIDNFFTPLFLYSPLLDPVLSGRRPFSRSSGPRLLRDPSSILLVQLDNHLLGWPFILFYIFFTFESTSSSPWLDFEPTIKRRTSENEGKE